MKISEMIGAIIPTLVFNIKAFGYIGAVQKHFPVFIGGGVKVGKITKGTITLSECKTGIVRIGFGGVQDMPANKGYIRIDDRADVHFHGRAGIGEGCDILIGKKSSVHFGKGFSAGKNLYLSSNKGVSFGEDVLLGWNVEVRDSDGHSVIINGEKKPSEKPVLIGNHVWIGSDTTLLKGSVVKDNSIIATKAVVTKQFDDENVVIGGFPAKVIERGANWER